MTETEHMSANAQAALDKLRDDEAELLRDIERLELRLDITREVLALLAGAKRGRPKGTARKAAIPVEPLEVTVPPAEEPLP